MARSPIKAASENDVTQPAKETLDFDDVTLRAIAEVYKNEGNDAYGKKDFANAIYFYTEGIKVKCKDGELNSKLYSNRATAHFYLENYRDSLSDARAATTLQPTYLKAIVRGASACLKLNEFQEAITWCDKGLSIDKNNKKLLEIRSFSDKQQNKLQDNGGEKEETETSTVKGEVNNSLQQAIQMLTESQQTSEQSKASEKITNLMSFLSIAQAAGVKIEDGRVDGNSGDVFQNLCNMNKAVEYYTLNLSIARDLGDKAEEGRAYSSLGNAFQCLGDFNKAVEYHTQHLNIAIDLGDKVEEGGAYGNLGNAFDGLGDFNKAVEYHTLHLSIARDVGDKAGEGRAYGNLGNAFHSLGDFNKVIEYHNLQLSIARDLGDKAGEGNAYGSLGNAFQSLGDFNKAVEYHNLHLSIARDLGYKSAEGLAYGNLGNAFLSLGDFSKAIEYHTLHLDIARDLGDKSGEGRAYANLGIGFQKLGDFNKVVEYLNRHLSIARDLGDKAGEGDAYGNLGNAFEILGDFNKAVECYQASVNVLNDIRISLRSRDEWKIGFRNENNAPYFGLYRVLLKQGKIKEALFAAEEGRAQALNDLMELQYASKSHQSGSRDREEKKHDLLSCISSSTAFLSIDNIDVGINIWVLSKGKPVYHRKKELDNHVSKNGARTWQSLIQSVYINTGVRAEVRCENRSLDAFVRKEISPVERSPKESSQPPVFEGNPLVILYNYIIAPIAHLVQGDELIVIPDRPLWLAPFAALLDRNSKYLCESFRIRLIPSLTSLKMIADCPSEYHSRSGALLVGDPWVAEVTNSKGKSLEQLPSAKEEVEMIGQIVKVAPVIGKKATKDEVLKRLYSVALVHIAAHGRMETGEIALTPNPKRRSPIPVEEDYLLTMADVMSVKLRARLVVLSCCHSGRGEIKAEGVVGIARAFMGAGARSVLVSLWAIDDEATLEFMRSFYHHLVKGRSASESLNQAMKCLRESDKYREVKYWAPFVLVGDDVTLQFDENE